MTSVGSFRIRTPRDGDDASWLAGMLVVSVLLGWLLLLATTASPAVAATTSAYDYDVVISPTPARAMAVPAAGRQGDLANYVPDVPSRRGYDDTSNLARTIARPTGDRVAPNTTAGGGDPCDPCPVAQGTIGSYGSLRVANAGHPECNAHHIIQHAAVREVSGYNRDAAPAIVLLGPPNVPGTPHYNATQAQRAATIVGTYGDERQVAVSALVAAGMPQAVIDSGLAAADGYFIGQLGLTYSSPTRPPGDRWGYGG